MFANATDPAHFHEWQQGVIDGHRDQPGPAQAGTKCLTTSAARDAARGHVVYLTERGERLAAIVRPSSARRWRACASRTPVSCWRTWLMPPRRARLAEPGEFVPWEQARAGL